ncbi:integrase, catalytic region, zinc finger, CCHC-type containing protein [Tanacetum coccineum]
MGLTEGERGFEQTKECYLTKVIPFFKIIKEHLKGIQKALIKEVNKMKEIFEELEDEVDQNVMDRKCDEIKRKNLLITNENLIADCLSKDVFYTATNSVLTVSRFSKMHNAYTIEQARCLELKAEISKLKHKIKKDDHSEMIKHFSNLEIDHLNLQLKYQNLKERFGNNKLQPSQDTPEFDTIFELKKMKASIQGKDNTIKKLKVENAKIKQHYKELYDSIKIMHAKTIENITALLAENENLKAHIVEKMKCVTMDSLKPKVLAPGVISSIEASKSKTRSNTMNNRILPAKSVNKKKVEDHPRNNKPNLKQMNSIDSSISFKRTVTNSNSVSLVKNVLTKVKQVWKATGKMFTNVGYQWKPTRKKFTLGEQCPLTRLTQSKGRTDRPLVFGFRLLKTYDGESFTAHEFREKVHRDNKIRHFRQKYVPRTPQQNDVVKRWNWTFVEAARTMLIFSKALMFLWAEAVATACYTQNRSLIHTHLNKTPYKLMHDKKSDLKFLRVFGALCYTTNDIEDLRKLKATSDIGIFVGYAPNRKGPEPILLTLGQISLGIVPNPFPTAPYVPPTNKDLDILFQLMFNEYLKPPSVKILAPPPSAV